LGGISNIGIIPLTTVYLIVSRTTKACVSNIFIIPVSTVYLVISRANTFEGVSRIEIIAPFAIYLIVSGVPIRVLGPSSPSIFSAKAAGWITDSINIVCSIAIAITMIEIFVFFTKPRRGS